MLEIQEISFVHFTLMSYLCILFLWCKLLLSEIPSLPQYMQSTQLPELAPIDGQMRLNNSQTNPTPIVQNDLKALKKSASLPQDTQERPELARRSLTQGPSHFNRALSAEEDISGEGTGIEEIK